MSAIRTQDGLTEWLGVTSGVRQGCVLSPLLFIVYMDKITLKIWMRFRSQMIKTSYMKKKGNSKSTWTAWTHNVGTLAWKSASARPRQWKSAEHLAALTSTSMGQCWNKLASSSILVVSSQKTDVSIERSRREFKRPTASATSLPHSRHPNIPIEIKAKLIESIFRPTLTYQSQTWTLTKSLERKITTCDMRYLREPSTKPDAIRSWTPRSEKWLEQHQFSTTSNSRESDSLGTWHAWHLISLPVELTSHGCQSTRQGEDQGRPGSRVWKKHWRATTSHPPRPLNLPQTESFFSHRRPGWYKRKDKLK